MTDAMPASGRKPAMRFYGTIFHPSSIEAMFGDYANGTYNVAWNAGTGNAPDTTIAQCLYWAYKTGDSPENRVVALPHLPRRVYRSGVDGPGGVSRRPRTTPAWTPPQTKPYAYLRYKYRRGKRHPLDRRVP